MELTIPAFIPQPQSAAALWLVLISCLTEGRRLSWPGWLRKIGLLRRFWPTEDGHPSQYLSHRSGLELNPQPSSREYNATTKCAQSLLQQHIKLLEPEWATYFTRFTRLMFRLLYSLILLSPALHCAVVLCSDCHSAFKVARVF